MGDIVNFGERTRGREGVEALDTIGFHVEPASDHAELPVSIALTRGNARLCSDPVVAEILKAIRPENSDTGHITHRDGDRNHFSAFVPRSRRDTVLDKLGAIPRVQLDAPNL
jgi:hypothetical protein